MTLNVHTFDVGHKHIIFVYFHKRSVPYYLLITTFFLLLVFCFILSQQ